MKKLIVLLCLVALTIAIPANATLYEFYQENGVALPSVQERAPTYEIIFPMEKYIGSYEQNVKYEEFLRTGGKFESFGATKPFRPSGYSSTLASSLAEGGTETTLTVNSITLPDDTSLATSSFGDLLILTVGEGDTEEKISITSLNASTKVFTIGQRGLEYGSYASLEANKHRHLPGERIYLSDDDHFINQQYFSLEGDETVTGDVAFTGGLTFTGANDFTGGTITIPEPALDTQASTKSYVDNAANQGAATGTETVQGIWEGATQLEMASSTTAGGSGNLALQAKYATSSAPSSGHYIPVTEADGNLDQGFLDLTEDFAFTGDNTHAGENTFSEIPTISTTSPTSAGQVVALDDDLRLPAVDGSLLTDMASSSLITAVSTTISETNTETVSLDFYPRILQLNYFIQGHTLSAGDSKYTARRGLVTYVDGVKVSNYLFWGDLANSSADATCELGADLSYPQSFACFVQSTNASLSLFTPDNGNGDINMALSVTNVSATGFSIVSTSNTGGGTNSNNARTQGTWTAFR